MSGPNKREFTRAPLNLLARIESQEGKPTDHHVVDLSMNGMLLSPSLTHSPGDEIHVELVLDTGDGGIGVGVIASVVRHTDDNTALRITGIEGEEALEHLRNLVLHHAENAAEIETEFGKHLGIKRRTSAE